MTSLDRVFNALEQGGFRPTRRARDFMALCPAHEERTGSLHVTWTGSDGRGRVLLRCHGCQAEAQEIAEALGLTMLDLYDQAPPERDRQPGARVGRSPRTRDAGRRRGHLGRLPNRIVPRQVEQLDHDHAWEHVETYVYCDDNGVVVQEVVRSHCTHEGCTAKDFRQRYAGDDGSMLKTKPSDFRPVLYRQPAVRAAVRDGVPVWLLEGEKDVHTAEELDLVACTNTSGGKGFPEQLAGVFAGADVVVVLDRDDTGWRRGVAVHDALLAAGASSIRLLLPATTAAKSDFTDHIRAGHGIDDLIPVRYSEVSTWAAVAAVTTAMTGLLDAEREVDAQLAEAERRRPTAPRAAEDHLRYARRWVAETERLWERLADAVDDVHRLAGAEPTPWQTEACDLVDRLRQQATSATRSAHEAAGVPVPEALSTRAVAASAAATEAPIDDEPEDDGRLVAGPWAGTTKPGGGGGGGTTEIKHVIQAPRYAIVDGQIVQVTERERGRGEDRFIERELKQVLSLAVRLERREYADVEDDTEDEVLELLAAQRANREREEVRDENTVAFYVLSYTHPVTGEQIRLRVPADRITKGDWLHDLPVPALSFDSRTSGRAKVWDAIRAVSTGAKDHTLYRGTGWRLDPEHGWVWAHADGLISSQGWAESPTLLDGMMRRYSMPDPTRDAQALRSAFLDHSAALMTRLPARVGVALAGMAYKAGVARNPFSVVLVGSPGSFKTSIASLAMHHYGVAWDRDRPGTSMSGNGATENAMRLQMHRAKDALFFLDDVAPGGDISGAQKRLGQILRMVHNQEDRARLGRDGSTLRDGTQPRASAIITSEIMPPVGSAHERAMIVPLQARECDLEQIMALDTLESRAARATLLSSMLSWAAGDLQGRREKARTAVGNYARQLRDSGVPIRQAEGLAHLWSGWAMMTEFLVDVGALSVAEQTEWLGRVHQALLDAGSAATDPDLPVSTGARVRELVAYALRSGLGYVTDIHTDEAPAVDGLAIRLGWRRVPTGQVDEMGRPRTRLEARGIRLGYINADPRPGDGPAQLVVDSNALEALIKAAGGVLTEGLSMDRGTAMRALYEEGVLIAEQRAGKTPRYTLMRTLHCETDPATQRPARRRMTVLDLAALLGDGRDDDPRPPAPSSGPVPLLDPPSAPNNDPQPSSAATEPSAPEDLEETPMVEPVDASVLPEPQECAWCHKPTRTAVDAVPLHPACWRIANEAVDALTHTEQAPSASPPEPTDTSTPVLEAPAPVPAIEKPAPAVAVAAPTPAPRREPAAPRPHTAPAARPTEHFAASVAVADVDAVYLPDGSTQPFTAEHLGHIADLGERIGLGTAVKNRHPEAGIVVVTTALAFALGLPVEDLPSDTSKRAATFAERTAEHPALLAALEDGWRVDERNGRLVRGWTTMWREGGRSVRLAFQPLLTGAALSGDPTPAALARRFERFAQTTGISWHVSPSSTGFDLMDQVQNPKRRDQLFVVHDPVPPATRIGDPDIDWTRSPTDAERELPYVHVYDRGGSYIAGVAGLELPVGDPVHDPDGRPFDRSLPGYWRIRVPETADWRMPSPVFLPRPREIVWVTTPTLDLATSLEYEPEIVEAFTWPAHSRLLDTWYARIREARTALDTDDVDDQAARDLLKEVYTRTIGMMGSSEYMSGRRHYAPERRHHIVAKARANLLRRIVQIGQDTGTWPLAVKTDSVLYASAEPDPIKAWPGKPQHLGRGFGQYKPERTGLLADQLKYLSGGTWAGKQELDKIDGATTADEE